jgi:uncharacterized protein involved in propanediol utilization
MTVIDYLDGSARGSKNFPRAARGRCQAHAGESVQGQLGRHRVLSSFPNPAMHATATFKPRPDSPVQCSNPQILTKSQRAVELTLSTLGRSGWGGELEVRSGIPRGKGLGSSCAEVVASVRAAAHAFGHRLTPEQELTIALHSDGAPDSIMFPHPVLPAACTPLGR